MKIHVIYELGINGAHAVAGYKSKRLAQEKCEELKAAIPLADNTPVGELRVFNYFIEPLSVGDL